MVSTLKSTLVNCHQNGYHQYRVVAKVNRKQLDYNFEMNAGKMWLTKCDVNDVRIGYRVEGLISGDGDRTMEEDLPVDLLYTGHRRWKRHSPQVGTEEVALMLREVEINGETRLTGECFSSICITDLQTWIVSKHIEYSIT